MTRLSLEKLTLAGAVAASALACSSAPPPSPAFVFNRPEYAEFVCINPDGKTGAAKSPLVLPLRCCATATPLNREAFFAEGERDKVCGEAGGSLHALVTQSTRGEVAAVDLVDRKVLDSDPRIPGFTFVDVGGLPRAIVTPSHKPGDPDVGPPWTYVASAEEQSLRAVATCHFREGAECGPEADRDAETLKLALPAQPKDMLLGPDDALWLTLPDVSALARVALPTKGDDPFAAAEITYFRLPVVDAATPAAPVPEASEYVTACGLGYALELSATDLSLPAHETTPGLGVASPTRLRLDADSGLLLVADASQPVIHALSIEADGVRVRGAIATGAAIRDFALTPVVPTLAPKPRAFVKRGDEDAVPAFADDEQRYLYAIDDGDGSVMVHAFSYADGALSSRPLRLPATRTYSDRLQLAAPATAIEIADNRALSDGFVCDWQRDDALDSDTKTSDLKRADEALKSADKALNAAEKAYAKAADADKDATKKVRDAAQVAYDKAADAYNELRSERVILDSAGPLTLRGVFALITTLDGRLGVIDVHDLDVFCRGEKWCKSDTALVDDDAAAAVAVRRHTVRLGGLSEATLAVSDTASFDAVMCADGQYAAALRGVAAAPGDTPEAPTPEAGVGDAGPVDAGSSDAGSSDGADPVGADAGIASEDDVLVCNVTDPWLNTSPGWGAIWEGAVFSASWNGRLEREPGKPTVLHAPMGLDLCARGVIGGDSDVEAGYAGDWVVITGKPPSYAPASCVAPEAGSEPHLRILEAYSDRLVLGEAERTSGFNADCYPDVVAFEVRAAERFFVYPRTTAFFHRVMADADGHCVADPSKDPRLVARAKPGQRFGNAFASFTLSKDAVRDRDNVIEVQATGSNNQFWQPIYSGSAGSSDSLPISLRYLSVTGDAYVVDVAQGLRRFTLTPFAADTTPYR